MRTLAIALLALAVVASAGALAWQGGSSRTKLEGFAPPADRLNVIDTESDHMRKLRLLDAYTSAPDILVLGSSRGMKVDPETIRELTGLSAFNLGVSGGSPADVYVLARYVTDRYGDQNFPHLLWALDVEALRDRPIEPTIWAYSPLRSNLPLRDRMVERLPVLRELADGPGVVAREVHDEEEFEAARIAADKKDLREDGFLLYDYEHDLKPPVTERAARDAELFAARVYGETGEFYPGPAEDEMRIVELTIEWANAHGDVPTIYLTPLNPIAIPVLDRWKFSERRAQVVAFLRQLQTRHEVRVIDATDVGLFGGNATEFYDSVHPQEATNDRLLAFLAGENLLTPTSPPVSPSAR